MQNGVSDDQTKEEVREELESGPFEIEGEVKTQAGSVHGGGDIQANPSVIQSGVQMYDTISDGGKSVQQEVYDTISARPESFHIITEAPVVQAETEEAVEENFATILLEKEASVTGVKEEIEDVSRSTDGLESYFGQLLQVTRHTDVDKSRNENNQEDSHTNVSDNAAAKLKDEIPSVGSTYNVPVKVSGENESQTIGENSHQKQVETHATAAKEALVGDSLDFKAKLEDLGSAPGHVQGSSTESSVIRYTWQNIPRPKRRIDSLSTTKESITTIPNKIFDDSLNSSNSEVPNKIIDISYETDFSEFPSDKPYTSHGSRSSSNTGNISHGSGEILKPEKGESEKPAPPPHLIPRLQNIKVIMTGAFSLDETNQSNQ